MMITCGNCHQKHASPAEVKACYASRDYTKQPASDGQRVYIAALIKSHEADKLADHRMVEVLSDVNAGKVISKTDAHNLIDALMRCPHRTEQSEWANEGKQWPAVPEGKYALLGDDGVVRFYQVDTPTEGRWDGWLFLSQLTGAPGDWRRIPIKERGTKRLVLEAIAKDVRQATTLFGRKTQTCGRCNSPLSTPQSRAAGYGEICADKMGWPYPSEQEALLFLGEGKPTGTITNKQLRARYRAYND